MTITINGKDYACYFGIDFIAALDRKFYFLQSGLRFGQGMTYVIAQIESGNPTVLVDLIQAATITENPLPTLANIKKCVEELAEQEKLNEVMEDFLSEFEKAPLTRFQMKKLGKLAEAAAEK